MTCRAAIELHPRGTLRSSPERITARACVSAAPTRRKEAVSFPFPAAERRKKFIVGGREGGESSGETETGPRAGEADMGAALDEGPDHKCIKDSTKMVRHAAF